jgi:membrane protein DedA with SNARE-associated domain
METIFSEISRWILERISQFGYLGITVTMAIESACIPLPSEIVMPFSGYLVAQGEMSLLGVSLAGAVGNLIGSLLAYFVGIFGGRTFVEAYGRYLLIREADLDVADRWFERYGEVTVFSSRLLPIVRTFISLPAGIARMNLPRFCLYTFVGSLLWNFALAYVGFKLEKHWSVVGEYLHPLQYVIATLLIFGLFWFILRHWPQNSKAKGGS